MRGTFNLGCASVQAGRETRNTKVSPMANETQDILTGTIWSPLVGLTFRLEPGTEDAAPHTLPRFFPSGPRELILVQPREVVSGIQTGMRPTKTSAGEGHDG